MGYDLNLTVANDEQIELLKTHPDYTRHFLEARRPTKTVTEITGPWFRKRKTARTEVIEINCQWPDSPPESVQLHLREGLYFLLNGTHDKVEAVTNFPNIGGRYRGEMLGKAIELGEVYLGHSHAFKSPEVAQLYEAVAAIDQSMLETRTQSIAAEMKFDDTASEIQGDMTSLKKILELAVERKSGILWFWA